MISTAYTFMNTKLHIYQFIIQYDLTYLHWRVQSGGLYHQIWRRSHFKSTHFHKYMSIYIYLNFKCTNFDECFLMEMKCFIRDYSLRLEKKTKSFKSPVFSFSGLFSLIYLPRNLSCSVASASTQDKLSLNFYRRPWKQKILRFK